jgi:hypothetical protein
MRFIVLFVVAHISPSAFLPDSLPEHRLLLWE